MIDRYATPLRYVAAALVLAGGLVHYKLWDGTKDWPNDNLSRMFLLNIVSSVAIAVALAVRHHWIPVVSALGLTVGSLGAFGISRTGSGLPGTSVEGLGKFAEHGWSPSPEAALALLFEISASAALVALLAVTPLPPPFRRDSAAG